MDKPADTSFIAIARIARTRGNRGEVLADLYTDNPERFNDLDEVWLEFNDGRRQARIQKKLEDVWDHKGRKVLKFEGVDTISDAEAWAGYWVMIPADQAVKLPEGTYFNHDLVGCAVSGLDGTLIGTVSEVLDIADNSQLVVRGGGREYLIPAVKSICVKVSIPDKRIIIDPPEGLLGLN
ncbi:MAG: ribosome maturation factor RimM [Acidobacteria bacterium]|nr:ribosome maturation factor RimM [Acidobacteriota bacterium]